MFQNTLTPLYNLLNKKIDIQVEGLENIKKDKNYIFAMNHQSIGDIPIAFSILVPAVDRKINLYMSHRFYNALFFLAIPLDIIRINMNKDNKKAQEYNRKQLQKGVEKLKQGNNALIYPEGHIRGGKKGKLVKAGTGIIRVALQSKVPILPIGIKDSNVMYPYLLTTKNPFVINPEVPVHVRIGKEINYDEYFDTDLTEFTKENRVLLRKLTNELMQELSILSDLPLDEEEY